uniref:ADP-ribosylhydrolase ARH3 n=1 Tax=Chromera velia CCMP2878 TaxID=1169474 RepID=A0A0G4HYJ3_9ALVE|eukprot:Cvel_1531.t1-p1 / transcript=Cvel_1531.t1 / gene=Cvel_1531 / organism=Chromera_velia_CCMP2878 / gene_product=hypothetical protein / transcript_product=hypothetical protein / location=Cvel_scaffold54:40576-45179(+) / protein_length=260 / sequence_SO=supercontig / SO=protein_coding / is_pseudo=false
MALRCAESVLDLEAFSPEDVASRYRSWIYSEDEDRAFDTGPTILMVFETARRKQVSYHNAARLVFQERPQAAGVNGAHRNSVLAACGFLRDESLGSVAESECGLTHAHPVSISVSQAVNLMVRCLLRGVSLEDAIRNLSMCVEEPRCRAVLMKALEDFNRGADRHTLSRGGLADDVLRASLFFLYTTESLREAVQESIRFAGADNYCPVLVGALAGALHGWKQEDEVLLRENKMVRMPTDESERLHNVAERLQQSWAKKP